MLEDNNFPMSLRANNYDNLCRKANTIKDTNLNVEYTKSFIPKQLADSLFKTFESEFVYFTGNMSMVRVFGKWHSIPRQQVAFGDEGVEYKFSGLSLPTLPWPESLKSLQKMLQEVIGHCYNFVLVNRYRNGSDCIGEHRDDESELNREAPIVSLSFGQTRDFVLKYNSKRNDSDKQHKSHILSLGHGDLLIMNPPTNSFWTHSVPRRRNANGVRINLTFRKIKQPGSLKRSSSSKAVTSPYFNKGDPQTKRIKQCS